MRKGRETKEPRKDRTHGQTDEPRNRGRKEGGTAEPTRAKEGRRKERREERKERYNRRRVRRGVQNRDSVEERKEGRNRE